MRKPQFLNAPRAIIPARALGATALKTHAWKLLGILKNVPAAVSPEATFVHLGEGVLKTHTIVSSLKCGV